MGWPTTGSNDASDHYARCPNDHYILPRACHTSTLRAALGSRCHRKEEPLGLTCYTCDAVPIISLIAVTVVRNLRIIAFVVARCCRCVYPNATDTGRWPEMPVQSWPGGRFASKWDSKGPGPARASGVQLPVQRTQLARSWPGNITPSSHRLALPSLVLSVNSACGGSEPRGESVREENLRQPTEAHRWNCVQLAE
jgi:hypothetical protein